MIRSSTDSEVVTLLTPPDNYTYCIISGKSAVVIDASSDRPVLELLEKRGTSLEIIVSTHHHHDHTAGNLSLKSTTGCTIIGGDRRIAGIDRLVADNETIASGPFALKVLATPGHTRGHIALYQESSGSLFTGDTLFYAGCGRLFEGTVEELCHSLMKMASMPPETNIYCGHEYTLDNLAFARFVEPSNTAVVERIASVSRLREKGDFTPPASLEQELETNPFLRLDEKEIRRHTGLVDDPAVRVFEKLRKEKDRF
jgi:hydroxyacylglutathione hydrolase